MPLNASEALVTRLARRTFLSLWSEPNPLARPGKELCDLLVVCDPEVIIFSVKEVELGDSGDATVDWERWRKRAIDNSVKQIRGAERTIRRTEFVVRADGSPGIKFPPAERLRVHRVAVALGGRGEVPFEQGDLGDGFVHVLDDESLELILSELDTVTDFVAYLGAKEALVSAAHTVISYGEADLLAVYLHKGRRFPQTANVLVIEPGAWEQLSAKPEWANRKFADRESRIWDGLIETLVSLTGVPGSVGAQDIETRESAFRVMAREDRFSRRVLASSFNEFMAEAAAARVRARAALSPSGVLYVFLATGRDEPREHRANELTLRCFVARGLAARGVPGFADTSQRTKPPGYPAMSPDLVIGLATERYVSGAGFSLDAIRLSIPNWTAPHDQKLNGIQSELGYFVSPRLSSGSVDEYPASDA